MAAEFLCQTIGGKGKRRRTAGHRRHSAARDPRPGLQRLHEGQLPRCQRLSRRRPPTSTAPRASASSENIPAGPADKSRACSLTTTNDPRRDPGGRCGQARGHHLTSASTAIDRRGQGRHDGKLAATVAQQPALMGQLAVYTAGNVLEWRLGGEVIPVALSW